MHRIVTSFNDDVLEVDDTELAQLTAQGVVVDVLDDAAPEAATPPAKATQATAPIAATAAAATTTTAAAAAAAEVIS